MSKRHGAKQENPFDSPNSRTLLLLHQYRQQFLEHQDVSRATAAAVSAVDVLYESSPNVRATESREHAAWLKSKPKIQFSIESSPHRDCRLSRTRASRPRVLLW